MEKLSKKQKHDLEAWKARNKIRATKIIKKENSQTHTQKKHTKERRAIGKPN